MDELKFKIYCELGDNYLMLGKLKEAKINFEKALNENSNSEIPYIGLAKIELKNGNTKKAKELIEKAKNINPENNTIYEVLAEIKFLQNEFDESYTLALKALEYDNENYNALLTLQKISYKLKKFDNLEKFLKIFHSKIPSDKNILYALAGCLYFQDKLEEAKNYLEKLLTIDKGNSKAKELFDIINKKIDALKEV